MNIVKNEQKILNSILLEMFIVLYGYVPSTMEVDAGIILTAQLLDEEDNSELKDKLLRAHEANIDCIDIRVLNTAFYNYYVPKNISKAFDILDKIKLKDLAPFTFINGINDVLLKRFVKYNQPVIPRWLASFMVSIANIDENSVIFDISSGCGNIIISGLLKQPKAKCYGLGKSNDVVIWAQLMNYILKKDSSNIFATDLLQVPVDRIEDENPTHIITAPFLGRAFYNPDHNIQINSSKSDDLFMQLALHMIGDSGRIVMLVSDGFLFEQGPRQRLREMMFKEYKITAIIGLNNGVLSGNSDIKANILIIDKVKGAFENNIFMSMVEGKIEKDTFACEEISELKQILSEFRRWDIEHKAYRNICSWVVQTAEIDVKNMVVNRYMPEECDANKYENRYQTIQLSEIVCAMLNGKTFLQDKDGWVKVLGSPSVRRMELIDVDIRYSDKLASNPFFTKCEDILINCIGNQIGESVIVDENHVNMLVGQNVILLTPSKNIIIPKYLEIALNSAYVQRQIKQRAGGTVYATISANKIKDIKIPVPSMEVQVKIVEKFHEIKTITDLKLKEYEMAKRKLDDLTDKLDPFSDTTEIFNEFR